MKEHCSDEDTTLFGIDTLSDLNNNKNGSSLLWLLVASDSLPGHFVTVVDIVQMGTLDDPANFLGYKMIDGAKITRLSCQVNTRPALSFQSRACSTCCTA